jgi:hypothetical protein
MDELMLYIIVILHFLFVMFVVITPFIGNNYFLLLHAIAIPFMVLHWYMNDNNCALTLMEKHIRYNLYGYIPEPDECFMHRLIAPVYDFKKNNDDMSTFIYIVTFSLWFYTLYRLYSNFMDGKLSKLQDLLMF